MTASWQVCGCTKPAFFLHHCYFFEDLFIVIVVFITVYFGIILPNESKIHCNVFGSGERSIWNGSWCCHDAPSTSFLRDNRMFVASSFTSPSFSSFPLSPFPFCYSEIKFFHWTFIFMKVETIPRYSTMGEKLKLCENMLICCISHSGKRHYLPTFLYHKYNDDILLMSN